MHLNLHNAFQYITKAGISDQSWQLRWDDLDIYKVNKFNRKVWMNIVCQLLTSIVELFFQVSKYYISWDITWQTQFMSSMGKNHFYPLFVSEQMILKAQHVAKSKSVWEQMFFYCHTNSFSRFHFPAIFL